MPIQLLFLDGAIRDLCERRQLAERLLGSRAARRLRARLADICAARKISEVVAGAPKLNGRGQIVFALHPPHRLILEPAMNPIPTKKNGEPDWDAIEAFRVLRID
jgi:proteic killer suppression protein